MRCPNCRFRNTDEDLSCRHCGANLIPTSTSTSIVTRSTHLPAVLQHPRLPQQVATGVGALALGVGIELLRRGVLTRLTPLPARSIEPTIPNLTRLKDILLPKHDKPVKRRKKGYEVEETVVYMRRVTHN